MVFWFGGLGSNERILLHPDGEACLSLLIREHSLSVVPRIAVRTTIAISVLLTWCFLPHCCILLCCAFLSSVSHSIFILLAPKYAAFAVFAVGGSSVCIFFKLVATDIILSW